MIRINKGTRDSTHKVLLECPLDMLDDGSNFLYYLRRHLVQKFGIDLMRFLNEDGSENPQKVKEFFKNREEKIWGWNKVTMSMKLRYISFRNSVHKINQNLDTELTWQVIHLICFLFIA